MTEAQVEPALAYEGPSTPREQEESQGSTLALIRSMDDEECTKLLDDLCAEQGF
jgi:hypothetical protein